MRASWYARVIMGLLMVGLLGFVSAPAMAKKKVKFPFDGTVLANSITRAFVLKPGDTMKDVVAFIDFGFSLHFSEGATFAGATINGSPLSEGFETLPGVLILMVSEKIKITSETDGRGRFEGLFTMFIDPITETSLFGTVRGSYEGELFPEVHDPVISPIAGSLKITGGTGWLEGVKGEGEYEGPQAVSEALACPGDPLQGLPLINPALPPGLNFAHSICLDLDINGELRPPKDE